MGLTANAQEGFGVDGGAVLLARPYRVDQWTQVRRGWWLHTAGMVAGMFILFPVYPLIALTVWQAPSRQTLGRRIVWASIITVGAVILIGIPPFVVFSRRWYWLWRSDEDPVAVGIPTARPDPSMGAYQWLAARGAQLADRIFQRPQLTAPANWETAARRTFVDPWAALVGEAGAARDRVGIAAARATGLAADRIRSAHKEAVIAANLAWELASHASSVNATVQSIPTESAAQQLKELESNPSGSADIEATRESLREQLATVERMQERARDLQDKLRRLVTQIGEAAVKAEELALGAVAPDAQFRGLSDAVDSLTATRSAFESMDTTAQHPKR
jgi:hypothetical protein